MYQYRIDCWVPPKSGFDLAKKAQFVSTIQSIFESMEADSPEQVEELRNTFNKFLEEGEGCVLDTIVIETDTPINSANDYEQILLPLVRQKNMYAKLVGCTLIPTL